MTSQTIGIPPNPIITTLRIEGLVALVAALVAFHLTGGNWWLFAILILAPDLAMLGALAGQKTGAYIYNLAHTYTVPALLGAVASTTATGWLLSVAIVWIAHIGMDRAVGYGLKYPGLDHHTHLGLIGKAKRKAEQLAHAG